MIPGHLMRLPFRAILNWQGMTGFNISIRCIRGRGTIFRRPAFAPGQDEMGIGSFSEADYNPVGSYVKRFDLAEGLVGKRVCICFDGVEQVDVCLAQRLFRGLRRGQLYAI